MKNVALMKEIGELSKEQVKVQHSITDKDYY